MKCLRPTFGVAILYAYAIGNLLAPYNWAHGVELEDLDYLLRGKAINQTQAASILSKLESKESGQLETLQRIVKLYQLARLPENLSRQSLLEKISLLEESRIQMRQQYNHFHEYLVLQKALLKERANEMAHSTNPEAMIQHFNEAIAAETQRILATIDFDRIKNNSLIQKDTLSEKFSVMRTGCQKFQTELGAVILKHQMSLAPVLAISEPASANDDGPKSSAN